MIVASILSAVIMLYLFAQALCRPSEYSMLEKETLCRPSRCFFHTRKHSVGRHNASCRKKKHSVGRQSASTTIDWELLIKKTGMAEAMPDKNDLMVFIYIRIRDHPDQHLQRIDTNSYRPDQPSTIEEHHRLYFHQKSYDSLK